MGLVKRLCAIARNKRGFTLTELLAATAIMVVLGTMIVAALPSASFVVKHSMNTSNADVLSSSVNTAVQDILRYAQVYVDADGNVVRAETGAPLIQPSSSYVDESGSNVKMAYLTFGPTIQMASVVDGVQQGLTPVPRSSGIYTDFSIASFIIDFVPDADAAGTYQPGVYQGAYTIVSNDGTFTKEYTFSCRPLATEAVVR